MARTTSPTQNRIDPTRPFFAAVGSVDLAVAVARTSITEAQARLAKVDFEPRAIPGRVEALVSDTVDDLNKQYVDLAARGRTLVGRIRRQQATQDVRTEATKTASRAKSTTTQTKKVAGSAKSSAKATGTSAKKTASAATKATRAAAAKTGA